MCLFCVKVLKWVEETVQSSKVHLLSSDHYSPVSNIWRIPFDPSLKEVTVALSGPAPNIEIRNPQGRYRVWIEYVHLWRMNSISSKVQLDISMV